MMRGPSGHGLSMSPLHMFGCEVMRCSVFVNEEGKKAGWHSG